MFTIESEDVMTIFFNPVTRPNTAKGKLCVVKTVRPDDPDYEWCKSRAYTTKEEALESGRSGALLCMDGENVLTVIVTALTDFHPLSTEPYLDGGINWSDVYFLTKELAERFAAECGCRNDGAQYNEETDVYCVHYHHSDSLEKVIALLKSMGWAPGVRRMSL